MTEVLWKLKSVLKPCFLFVCILAGFAFERQILDEHTPHEAFSIKRLPVFKKLVYFKSEAIHRLKFIVRVTVRKLK